nr:hypothetical protein BaRGS_029938 [Batillaria attramentaria]
MGETTASDVTHGNNTASILTDSTILFFHGAADVVNDDVTNDVSGSTKDMDGSCNGFFLVLMSTGGVDLCFICDNTCGRAAAVFVHHMPQTSNHPDTQPADSSVTQDPGLGTTLQQELEHDRLGPAGDTGNVTAAGDTRNRTAVVDNITSEYSTGKISGGDGAGSKPGADDTGNKTGVNDTRNLIAGDGSGNAIAGNETGNEPAARETGKTTGINNDGNVTAADHTGSYSAADGTGNVTATDHTGNVTAADGTGTLTAADHTGNVTAANDTDNVTATDHTGNVTAVNDTGTLTATDHTGNVTAANDTGTLTATDHNGNVTATNDTGTLTATDHNGNVTATDHNGNVTAANDTGDDPENVKYAADNTQSDNATAAAATRTVTPDTSTPVTSSSSNVQEPTSARDCFNNDQFVCVHGTCLAPGVAQCVCDKGWVGTFCRDRCTRYCGARGTCKVDFFSGDEFCSCPYPWQGPTCDDLPEDTTTVVVERVVGEYLSKTMDAENEHFRFHTFMRLKLGDNGKKILQDLQAVFGAKCVDYSWVYWLGGGLGVGLLLLVTGGVVLMVYLWKKRFIVVMKIVYYFQPYEDDDRKLFDAFVSYRSCTKDMKFVYEALRHKLEDEMNFHLCLHERDFIPGEPIANNILWATENSRRTILVLSPRYLESDWARMEYQQAQYESLKRKQRIVPIMLEDINDFRDTMDPNLACILRTVTYIRYPNVTADDRQLEKFWKRLELSMPKKKHVFKESEGPAGAMKERSRKLYFFGKPVQADDCRNEVGVFPAHTSHVPTNALEFMWEKKCCCHFKFVSGPASAVGFSSTTSGSTDSRVSTDTLYSVVAYPEPAQSVDGSSAATY